MEQNAKMMYARASFKCCKHSPLARVEKTDSAVLPQSETIGTLERARWPVWHAIHHGSIAVCDALRIAFEECRFIQKDYDLVDGASTEKRITVRWVESRNGKWYPVAMTLMCKMMTDSTPVECITELTRSFSIESIRWLQSRL